MTEAKAVRTESDIQPLVELLEEQQLQRIIKTCDCEANRKNCKTHCHMGKKFARVDIGGSGRYMVELETGIIYGIKAYGVIHRGHIYGTLDTIHDWDWSDHTAFRKAQFKLPSWEKSLQVYGAESEAA